MSTAASTRTGLLVAHHHPGRLRVRTEAFLDAAPTAERTRSGLARMHGVRSVAHDPRSGSLLIEYDPRQVDIEGLIGRIGELSGLSISEGSNRPQRGAAARIVSFVRKVNHFTESATGRRVSLGVVVPASLVAAGAYSFFKSSHERWPRWDNLAYWAYSVFVHAHADAARRPP